DRSRERYKAKLRHAKEAHGIRGNDAIFIEIEIGDSSDFEGEVKVRGVERLGYRVLVAEGSTVANTIAAVLLHLQRHGHDSHVYFRWTEGNPLANFAKFLFLGEGEVSPMTREVLREAEPDVQRRPWVHVA
ncbi:MAG: amino acid transporter, partial [Actinobacteria bacterium]|nr:amino acid transporter [Actinomycetota bacterium]